MKKEKIDSKMNQLTKLINGNS